MNGSIISNTIMNKSTTPSKQYQTPIENMQKQRQTHMTIHSLGRDTLIKGGWVLYAQNFPCQGKDAIILEILVGKVNIYI